MAKTNKFTSINFNHVYDKTPSSSTFTTTATNPIKAHSSSSSSSSTPFSSYSVVSAPKPHGRMLVLTRPTPKPTPTPTPISTPPPSLPPQQTHQLPPPQIHSEPSPDAISLRPLGRTGAGSSVSSPVLSQGRDKEAAVLVSSPKPDKFVPPHLRPGFVAKEDRARPWEAGHKFFGPPGRFWEDGCPKSSGWRGGDSNLGLTNRPGSSGWNRILASRKNFSQG